MKHIIIVPYFSEQEIDRYLRIAERMASFPKQKTKFEFLLAASPRIEPSDRLFQGFNPIAPAVHFQCPTKIFGYPQGPTAMFWDALDQCNATNNRDGGFALWMESDMIPVKPNWLDRLDTEWNNQTFAPLIMGRYVPDVQKHRFFRKKRLWIKEHINGGACYAKDFVKHVPLEARGGVFDTFLYQFLKDTGRVVCSNQIAFSTVGSAKQDTLDPRRVLLHGFMQDKDKFLSESLSVTPDVAGTPIPVSKWDGLHESYRKFMLRWVIRGKRAMLEAMLLAQKKMEREESATYTTTEVAPLRKAA